MQSPSPHVAPVVCLLTSLPQALPLGTQRLDTWNGTPSHGLKRMTNPPGSGGPAQPPSLVGLTDPQVLQLKNDLALLIGHIARRIEYAESRRQTIAVLAGTLIAASIATLALTLTNIHHFPARFSLIVMCVGLVGVGLVTWTVYMRQTNYKYPFTQVTQTWKWFYRYALQNYEAFDAGWHAFQSKERFERGKRAFDEQWDAFKTQQIPGLADLRTSTLQDMEQVYLLHVNERYKNLFLTQLRKILNRGVTSIVVLGLVSLALSGWVGKRVTGMVSRTSTFAGKRAEVLWRETGQTRAITTSELEIQLLVNVRIEDSTIAGSRYSFIARDDLGFALPIFVESFREVPHVAGVNQTEAVSLVWVPASVRKRLTSFALVP